MKTFIKLLLLAAVALPSWPAATAQTRTAQPNEPAKQGEVEMAVNEYAAPNLVLPSKIPAAPVKMTQESENAMFDQIVELAQTTALNPAIVKGPDARKLVACYDHDSANGTTARKAPLRADAEVITPPADVIANAEEWKISTNFYNYGASGFIDFGNTINVAVDGDDIYIQGLCLWLPDAWVKGSINGNTATFTSGQFFGTFTQNGTEYDMYFVGWDTYMEGVTNVTFNYSASAHKLTLQEDLEILIGADGTSGGYYAYHLNTVIAKEYVTPPVPVELANGNDANQRIPIYGNRYANSTTSQMIYPASMLTNFEEGQQIKSVTFYTNENGIKFSGGQITVTIGTTDQTYFTGNNALTISGTTATATVVPVQNSTTLKVEFSNPLVYTAGSNIIIQMVNTTTGTAAATNWMGVAYSTGEDTYYSYTSRGYNPYDSYGSYPNYDEARRFRFMPKATFELQFPPMLTDELNFGTVKVGQSKTMKAFVENANSEAVTATVTISSPFSASTSVELQPGVNAIPVTFTPTDPMVYNGTLTVNVNGVDIVIPLKGTGQADGPLAIRDKAFFEGITYKWTDEDGNKHRSNLAEIATDPDQIIAMLKEVYTNQNIPGNYKRGYSNTGGSDHDDDVTYTGVGTINSSYAYVDSYGWNIPGTVRGSSYRYMDPDQYKPNQEGVTLLLLEIVDTFTPTTTTTSTHNYAALRGYFKDAIKSARIITQAKRTGEEYDRGTLFKIDCDKMNKFYLIAKGQLQWHKESVYSTTGYGYPVYYSGYYYDAGYYDAGLANSYLKSPAFLCHMFEQLSPSEGNAESPLTDGYKMFVTEMKSFGIIHDCPNAPFVNGGHHFMMYGQESAAADCQDIRDMMFLVPDYRMMDWTGRGTKNSSGTNRSQDYFYYHENHRPTMGVFVIHQDEVEEVTKTDDYYMLKLTWDSNLDEFLPADQQEYQLWQVVIDEFGVSHYEPVYYMNEDGQYTDAEGNVVNTPVPIVLERSASADKKTYENVYVKRGDSSKTVTFAVRGQDKDHFLSLQMSNEQDYFIKGKDATEVAVMSSATVYSRFEAQAVRNCYSNKIKIASAPQSIKEAYLPINNSMTLSRSYSKKVDDETVTVTEPIATLKRLGGVFEVSGSVLTDVKALFPKGTHDKKTAGYHANTLTGGNQISYTTSGGYINFNFELWDNFVVDVAANEHPGLYTYQLSFTSPVEIDGADEHSSNHYLAHSNPVSVIVYKTDSEINKPLTLDQVNGDTSNNPDYSPGNVEFKERVQLSSKNDILRYDAYRWNEGETRSILYDGGDTDEDEEDEDPNGIAGNQGDSYTVSMNAIGTADYYVGEEVPVTTANPQNWVTFVDKYPTNLETGGAYTYAPVVELFTKGYQAGSTTKTRGDYNTYGGPLQNTAVGKLDLKIDPELGSNQAHAFMSTYYWENVVNENTSEWCAYYDIPIKFKALDVPDEYQIYKVRAWREVDPNVLREEYPSREGRKVAKYLYEEINYGEDLGMCDVDGNPIVVNMTDDELFREATSAGSEPYSYALGSRNPQVDGWFTTSEATLDTEHETHATFGALRIDTKDGRPYSMENLEATLKVRAYFVKTHNAEGLRNPLVTTQTRDDVANPADFDYYVAEGEVKFKSSGYEQIITGISAVKMDVNREVVGVTYVNALGMTSSEPWQGVNIVVTRYSDGSTTTKKVIR